MKLDVPTGTTYYWNPYSPKFYTIVQSPTGGNGYEMNSDDEGSFRGLEGSYSGSTSSADLSHSLPPSPTKHHHSQYQQLTQYNQTHSSKIPTDDVYNLGWATISSVRQEKSTDAAVATMIQRFPMKTLTAMAAVIENSPNLFLELCEKERGNVVSHVMNSLKGDQCQELMSMTCEHTLRLATDQSGCIALTRIFDAVTPSHQAAIAEALAGHFDQLMCHQFGNFVLSRIAQTTAKDGPIAEQLCLLFENASSMSRCLNDKCGSHVFEAFVKNCGAKHLFRVCAVLFSDMDMLMNVATSKFANYPLQACLKQMMTHDTQHELSRWAQVTIPILVADTKFATNINRAMGFGRTADMSMMGSSSQNVVRTQHQHRRTQVRTQ